MKFGLHYPPGAMVLSEGGDCHCEESPSTGFRTGSATQQSLWLQEITVA
jgi:hypothetical protein